MYTGGDLPKPETNQNYLRLYGHTLCPYVGIARYSLALKKINFQDVQTNMDTKGPANKGDWHLKHNGGIIPILETPAGDLINESGVISHFAVEHGKDQGLALIPSDPIAAAKMRLEIEAFHSKTPILRPIMYPSRGTDNVIIDKFGAEGLPAWEALCAKATGDKWLFGTDEPTLLDVHTAPFMELIYLWQDSVMSNVTDRLEL